MPNDILDTGVDIIQIGGGGGAEYTGVSPIVVDNDTHEISLSSSFSAGLATTADLSGKADTSAIPSLDGYATQQWVGEQGYLTEVPASATSSFVTSSDVNAAISGKADTTAIPSLDGYATQQWVGEQGYLTSVPASAISGKADTSALTAYQPAGDYYSASNPLGFISEVPASAISGKLDTSATTNWDKTAYSAGTNIDVTNHVISGKSWSTEITQATSGKLNASAIQITASLPASPVNGVLYIVTGT